VGPYCCVTGGVVLRTAALAIPSLASSCAICGAHNDWSYALSISSWSQSKKTGFSAADNLDVATNHDGKAAPSKDLRFIGLGHSGLVVAAADAMMLEAPWQGNIVVSLTFLLFVAGTDGRERADDLVNHYRGSARSHLAVQTVSEITRHSRDRAAQCRITLYKQELSLASTW
jgi:hypothetical protein